MLGTDVTNTKDAAVVSWKLGAGVQFLVNGPRAYLVFESFRPTDSSSKSHTGFSIRYEAISNIIVNYVER